MFVESSQT